MPLPEELAVIDAALAGEPVDPAHADLAELALLLTLTRPDLPADVGERLDARFAALDPARKPKRSRRTWRVPEPPHGGGGGPLARSLRPAFGAGLAVCMAAVVVVLAAGSGKQAVKQPPGFTNRAAAPTLASAGGAAGSQSLHAPSLEKRAPANAAAGAGASTRYLPAVPTPAPSSRKTIQSAQLQLTAPNGRIPAVAQEVFDVVGAEDGIVAHSQVTAAAGGGYASFTLEIPAQNLQATLARLSQLRYAGVSSSTGTSSDVNSRYQDDRRALADARALRSSLLRLLQSAVTATAVSSLKAQIRDAEATIAADERTLNALNGRIAYSRLNVQISPARGGGVPGPGGFTLHRALHDALEVLTYAAGILLIAAAVLVPLALIAVAALTLTRRRRRRLREAALDDA